MRRPPWRLLAAAPSADATADHSLSREPQTATMMLCFAAGRRLSVAAGAGSSLLEAAVCARGHQQKSFRLLHLACCSTASSTGSKPFLQIDLLIAAGVSWPNELKKGEASGQGMCTLVEVAIT